LGEKESHFILEGGVVGESHAHHVNGDARQFEKRKGGSSFGHCLGLTPQSLGKLGVRNHTGKQVAMGPSGQEAGVVINGVGPEEEGGTARRRLIPGPTTLFAMGPTANWTLKK